MIAGRGEDKLQLTSAVYELNVDAAELLDERM
jgi:hypothetical protein